MPELSIEHILQPAILVRNMDQALDFLHKLFGIYPSERVDIRDTGVNNAVYALADHTFLELIEPYDRNSSAGRLLERRGEGWHMLSCDLEDIDGDSVESCLDANRIRVVRRGRTEYVRGAWHLHPRDTFGVLLNLVNRSDHDENGMWSGWAWREYVATNTHVINSILGISIVTTDLDAARRRYDQLGFRFQNPGEDPILATTPRGTSLRIYSHKDSSARDYLDEKGAGLYQLCFGARDLEGLKRRFSTLQIPLREYNGGLCSRHSDTLGVPMTFQQIH